MSRSLKSERDKERRGGQGMKTRCMRDDAKAEENGLQKAGFSVFCFQFCLRK